MSLIKTPHDFATSLILTDHMKNVYNMTTENFENISQDEMDNQQEF
jgi:hypothetical protein